VQLESEEGRRAPYRLFQKIIPVKERMSSSKYEVIHDECPRGNGRVFFIASFLSEGQEADAAIGPLQVQWVSGPTSIHPQLLKVEIPKIGERI
jgi:hypothetical protein